MSERASPSFAQEGIMEMKRFLGSLFASLLSGYLFGFAVDAITGVQVGHLIAGGVVWLVVAITLPLTSK